MTCFGQGDGLRRGRRWGLPGSNALVSRGEGCFQRASRAQFLGDPPLLPQHPMCTPFYSASPHLGHMSGCGASLPPPCTLQPWGGAALIQAYAGKQNTDTSPDAQGDSPLIRAFQHFPQDTVGFTHRCCLREGAGTLTESVSESMNAQLLSNSNRNGTM